MRFLLLCSTHDDTDDADDTPVRKKSFIREWYSSVRNGFNRSKDRKVTISDPIPLSIDDPKQIGGIVKVQPNVEDVAEENVDNTVAVAADEMVNSQMVNAETNTENTNDIQDVTDGHCEEECATETDQSIVCYSWYWGNISRRDAENLLRGKEDGTFLVRKSSDQRFLYSLSFRSNGKTMHTRIEYSNKLFCFFSNDSSNNRSNDGSSTLGGLISEAMNQNSADNIFFYSRGLKSESSLFTVSLTQPLSRFDYLLNYDYSDKDNKTLKYFCKFILLHTSIAQYKLKSCYDTVPDEIQKFLKNNILFPPIKQKQN